MLSEEEKKEFLDAAASESLRRDFEIMRRNVERSPLSPADFARFLSSCHRIFGPGRPSEHRPYPKALI